MTLKTLLLRTIQGIWYFLASCIILAAILVNVARLATPLLNQHRQDIEKWASSLLQTPISIGEVQASWRGYIPEVSFTHVVALDKQTHHPAFEIGEVKLGFRWLASLWQRKIVLQDMVIVGAEVTLLEDATGALSLKDLPMNKKDDFKAYQLETILQWIFAQPYLAVRNIDVQLISNKKIERNLTFKKIVFINNNEQHKINSYFILHQQVPTKVKSQIAWQGKITDPAHIKAQAYFNVAGFSLNQWLKMGDYDIHHILPGWQIHRGIGGADLWLNWEHQQLQQLQSVFQWYDLEFFSEFDQKTHLLPRLSGHVGWKREGEKQILAGDNFLIDFPQHFWPATNFYIVFSPPGKKSPAQPVELTDWRLHELHIGYLNLENVLPLVLANAHLSAHWRKTILSLHPSGELQNLKFSWRGPLTDWQQLSALGEVKNLSFRPWQNWPGIKNLTANLQWDGHSGNIRMDSRELTLTWHTLFSDPLIFDECLANIRFEHKLEGGWSLQTDHLVVNDADLVVNTALKLLLPPGQSPVIDLNGKFSLADVAEVTDYLPTAVMNHHLVDWLDNAFLRGRIEAGKIIVQGNIADFPFADEAKTKGHFEMDGVLKNVDFRYANHWPIIHHGNGQLSFSGRSMKVSIDSAAVLDIPLKQVTGFIPSIANDKTSILAIHGQIQTDVARALNFIHQSPLEETIGKDLEEFQLEGPMSLDLSLSVPLISPEKTAVLGKVQLARDKLTLPQWNLVFDQLSGELRFSENNISAEKIQGILWGQPTLLQLTTLAATNNTPSYLEAKVMGKTDISQLDQALNLSLANFLSGSFNYQARVHLYKSPAIINKLFISSDLQGLAVNLPEPFGKEALRKRDFSFNVNIEQIPPYVINFKYADLIQAQLHIAVEKDARIIDIDSPQMKGRIYLAYPFDHQQVLQAQLERLTISAGNSKTISSISPLSIPPLEISVKQFIYNYKNLGQLTLTTEQQANGMNIQSFNLATSDYSFKSHGQWTISNKVQHSQLQGMIESSKLKRFLWRLDMHLNSLIVEKGRAAFNLQWSGAPYSFALAHTTGNFSFALEKGRIINLNESNKSKMDLGRMLSLFSLQTIPRRLSLDFTDLFEQGYSFDFIRGDFNLKHGDAFTQKEIAIEGPVAQVSARGRIGLLKQDYDLVLQVSPHVTESLPVVAGAITLNPLVGAAAWLVNKVVSNEVSKAITYQYTVTGPWSDPVWQSSAP